ncbi:MAG: hypothetical protein IKP28_01095 [Clostridia bacterium]|nr:hypothetical protein [Clostridia bacterium]
MKEKSSNGSKIFSVIFIVLVLAALLYIYNMYKENYFGDFVRAEYNAHISEFKRDRQIKYGSHDSYKIISNEFNDAMISKTVSVTPNTPYRVSCMIKTDEVLTQNINSIAGAGICIADTTECSKAITGTTDWTKVEFMFDSKDRTEVSIGFRLGSYTDDCKGTAWFSDLKLEVGVTPKNTEWKIVCFVFDNLDVTIEKDGKQIRVQESMTQADKQDMKDNMARAKSSFKTLSNYNMTVEYEIIEIKDPITTISHDDANGYYVSPSDISKLIQKYVEIGEYDFIFAAVKFGEEIGPDLDEQNNWIGLGGMDYHDIGFANIRLPNDEKSYIYKYDANINLFPEEAFIHEFCHTLERISKENGYEYPILHDYEKYGYKNEAKYGLMKWYGDFMSQNIKQSHGRKLGIDPNIYQIKPIHKSSFNYAMEIEFDKDPDNIIEEIRAIINTIANAGKNIKIGETDNT